MARYSFAYAKMVNNTFFVAADYSISIGQKEIKDSKMYGSYKTINLYFQIFKPIFSKFHFYEQVHHLDDSTSTIEFYDLDSNTSIIKNPDILYSLFIEARMYYSEYKNIPFNFDHVKCLNSSLDSKISLHILYRGLIFNDIQHHKIFVKDFISFIETKLNDDYHILIKIIDVCVYSKHRCFRNIWCSKMNSNRILIPFDNNISYLVRGDDSDQDYFITNIQHVPNNVFIWNPQNKPAKTISKNLKTNLDETYNIINTALDSIIDMIDDGEHSLCEPGTSTINYQNLSKLKLILNNELGEKGFDLYEKCISCYKHGADRKDELESYYTSGSVSNDKKPLTIASLIYWAKENPDYTPPVIPETTFKDRVLDAIKNPKTVNWENVKIRYNQHDHLDDIREDKHIQVIVADTGFGKTKHVADYIKGNRDKSILSITSRVSLADFQMTIFEGMKHYKKVFGESPHQVDKLIIEFESLFKLEPFIDNQGYDILILDEFTDLISKINSKTCNHNGDVIFSVFISLIQNATQIIITDADFDQNSYIVLKQILEPYKSHINITVYTKPKNHQLAYLTNDKEIWNQKLLQSLNENKRIAIALTSPSKLKTLESYIKDNYPSLTVKSVFKETPDDEKQDLFTNLDAHIENCDVFLYSPTMSHGVSYIKQHFHEVYAYFCPEAQVHYRILLQLLRRFRNIESGNYYIWMNPKTTHQAPESFEELEHELERAKNPFGWDIAGKLIHRKYNVITKKFTYPNKDAVYHMYIRDLMSRNTSENQLLELFISTGLKRGFTFDILDDIKGDIEKELRIKRKELTIEHYEEIALLPIISNDERDKLINKRNKDREEIMLLEKRLLADEYNLDRVFPGLFNAEFLKKYSNASVINARRHLFEIDEVYVKSDKVFENIKLLKQCYDQEHQNYQDQGIVYNDLMQDCNYKKHYYCHLLCSYLGFKNAFDYEPAVHRNVILENWNKNIDIINQMKPDIDYWFKKKDKSIINDWDNFQILRYVNGCLSFYGISIKNVNRKKQNRIEYKIYKNENFNDKGLPRIGKNTLFV